MARRAAPPQLSATDSIASLLELPSIDRSTCLCLDLDDVLLKTTQYTGSEAWEVALVQELMERHGFPEPQARGVAGQLWRGLHWVVDSEPPEGTTTAEVVGQLQRRALRVIGLTARDAVLIPLTVRQLAAAGISFGGAEVRAPSCC